MSEIFSIATVAGWGDMDANAHMANVAYMNKCVDSRMSFFTQNGFPATEFARRRIGPVVRRDEIDYYREVALLEPITVTLALGGCAPDGSRFRLVNEVVRADGKVAARVRTEGGWLDLEARKLIAPPPEILMALQRLTRSDDFEELQSSLRT
ncbi:MAG: thioesterase [Steroidobacteraceae bacterium]|nr:thioesterase [Steroidobacteraceae bacterium]MBM2854659.1 thioesterase [Steroidobacteraceae bacterium]